MKNNPKVSIITPSFNSVKTIEKTILSILSQTYEDIECIIIDGGSTDGTVDIIKKYQDKIHYWVSEKDRGISDAFNKGLVVSSGDYINFQGADDYLLENNVIDLMMKNVF
jgi:glycosyltransferase involved in cell wall biosynthesis